MGVTNLGMAGIALRNTMLKVPEGNSKIARWPKSVAMKAKDTDGRLQKRMSQIQKEIQKIQKIQKIRRNTKLEVPKGDS